MYAQMLICRGVCVGFHGWLHDSRHILRPHGQMKQQLLYAHGG